jgi:hypothetical protein
VVAGLWMRRACSGEGVATLSSFGGRKGEEAVSTKGEALAVSVARGITHVWSIGAVGRFAMASEVD